jgi:hypothetical protein
MTMSRIITLLTDFGTADGYVGEMKGMLLSLVPDAALVDITHEIPAQDVEAGRLTVARIWRRFRVERFTSWSSIPAWGRAGGSRRRERRSRSLVGQRRVVAGAPDRGRARGRCHSAAHRRPLD